MSFVSSPPTPVNTDPAQVAVERNGYAPPLAGVKPGTAEQVGHGHKLLIVAAQVPGVPQAPNATSPGIGPPPSVPPAIQLTPSSGQAIVLDAAGLLDGCCYGPDGNMWACDQSNSFVWRCTPQGVATSFACPTSPRGICAGPDGNLWVTDQAGNVYTLTPAGAFTAHAVGGSPDDICAGPDGRVWYTDDTGNIGAITTAGVATTYPLPAGITPGSGYGLGGICIGPDGLLWFVGSNPGYSQVFKISTSGVLQIITLPSGSGGGICVGADGRVWINSVDLMAVTTDGVATIIGSATGGSEGICPGPDGAVWVSIANGGPTRFSTAGVNLGELPLPGGSAGARGIASGPGGAVWVAANGAGAVFCVFAVYGTSHASNPALPANPPVSGTVYQNNTGGTLRLRLPVYATTLGTAGTATLARGPITPPTALSPEQVPGSSTAAAPFLVGLTVPNLWYWSITVSASTLVAAQIPDQLVT